MEVLKKKQSDNSSRTKNTTRNIISSMALMGVQLLFQFIIRSVIVHSLGAKYLGLSSLFASILSVLSMAELGFSTAIIFNLYQPLAENDNEKVCSLLAYYKKIYKIVGIIILIAGLAMLPFLQLIIKGNVPADINMYLLYILYLFNTSITYFLFAHQTALLTAVQRLDLTQKVTILIYIIESTLQVFVLIYLKNYYVFLILLIIGNASINLVNAYVANKRYPQYICKGKIDKDTKKDIAIRVKGLLICRISGVTYTSLDSIIISSFIGLTSVAIYNNYITIFSSVGSVIVMIRSSMQASIGNSVANESLEKNYQDLLLWQFLFSVIATFCASCMICLFHPFMSVWMGDNMTLSLADEVIITAWFFISIVQHAYYLYLSGNGLWDEMKWSYIFSTVFNLIMNIVLGKLFGIFGIILASFLSNLICGTFWQCIIIFKRYFKRSSKKYLLRQGTFFVIAAIICAVSYLSCSIITVNGIAGLIFKAIVCVVVTAIFLLIAYIKTEAFKQAMSFMKGIIGNKKKKMPE